MQNQPKAYSRVIMVVPLTSQNLSRVYPHEVLIKVAKGLTKASKANVSQMRAIDRSRVKSKLGSVDTNTLIDIDAALRLHLGLS